MLTDWKKSIESQWSSIHKEWATEREEWESKVKNVGTAAAKFDAGLASLVMLQRQQWQRGLGLGVGMGNVDVVKGFHGSSGCGGLVTPPSLRGFQ
jgi:hypothetical protein